MITLRPDQQELKNGIYNSWNTGARNVLGVLPTGGGKSVVWSDLSLDLDRQGQTQAVLAHRNELVSQLSIHMARRGIFHNLIAPKTTIRQIIKDHREEFNGASFVSPNARCSVGGVDTIVSREAELQQWARQISVWGVDECFPNGTKITTPNGKRNIEEIKKGDWVISFNEITGSFENKKVTRLFKNPTPFAMVQITLESGEKITTTYNHPFWTRNGWVEAGKLTNDHECYLHDVRQSSRSCTQAQANYLSRNRAGILFQTMLEKLSRKNIFRNNEQNKPEICVRSDERAQPNALSRKQKKNERNPFAHWTPTENKGWERPSRDGCGKTVDKLVTPVRVSRASNCSNGDARGGIPDTLQNRRWKPTIQNCDRGGWFFSLFDCAKRTRHKKRPVSCFSRVASVEIYKSTDIDGNGDGFVYNIEVDENHTYIANGIIVHNCHHVLRENKWGKVVGMFPGAYGVGWTATPSRADKKGLGSWNDGVFDDMIIGPPMRYLIEIGALSDYEIIVPESDFQIDENSVGANGDFSNAKMKAASAKSQITGDVVKEYMKNCHGMKAIVFATDTDAASKMATNFKNFGYRAASVSAKTDATVRNDYIRKFKNGYLDVLINVDLFGEGFDVPAVEVVIMARPTASLSVYLQQAGRALRQFAGKEVGLIIDMVSNWKRHGFPDKPRVWSLDRPTKKKQKQKDPEDVELIACNVCTKPYEKVHPACPHCGAVPVKMTAGRTPIEQVDGDLIRLDRATLAQMRAAADLESPASVYDRVRAAAGEIAAKSKLNNQRERIETQEQLKNTIAEWAGLQRYKGRKDDESYRRFYLATGVDVLSALSLPKKEMENMITNIQEWIK